MHLEQMRKCQVIGNTCSFSCWPHISVMTMVVKHDQLWSGYDYVKRKKTEKWIIIISERSNDKSPEIPWFPPPLLLHCQLHTHVVIVVVRNDWLWPGFVFEKTKKKEIRMNIKFKAKQQISATAKYHHYFLDECVFLHFLW